eukprot:9641-Heterococcus_DN1.PRE.2
MQQQEAEVRQVAVVVALDIMCVDVFVEYQLQRYAQHCVLCTSALICVSSSTACESHSSSRELLRSFAGYIPHSQSPLC